MSILVTGAALETANAHALRQDLEVVREQNTTLNAGQSRLKQVCPSKEHSC
jgi:hypothetical protein